MKADPAQRAGMHVADGPVRIVREALTALMTSPALEGRHAVEGDGIDHHAQTGSVRSLSQAPLSVIRPLIMPPQLGIHSMIEKVMPSVCAQSGSAV
jgi:hypothetical protein